MAFRNDEPTPSEPESPGLPAVAGCGGRLSQERDMSLRDFLLDYAEKAPKAVRVQSPLRIRSIRFRGRGGRECCPLEIAVGLGYWKQALAFYDIDEFEEGALILDAADHPSTPEDRCWRAVLEKLAEPEKSV